MYLLSEAIQENCCLAIVLQKAIFLKASKNIMLGDLQNWFGTSGTIKA